MKLPIPSSRAEVVGKLNDMGSVQNAKGVNQEFAQGIQTFRRKLKRMMKPKKAWPQVGNMHGSHLAKFLQEYISTINDERIPCIESLWEDVVESLLEASVNKANSVYEREFGSLFAKNVPCDEIDILKHHDRAFCKAMDLFTEETQHITDASLRIKHLRKLKDIIIAFEKDTVTITGGMLSRKIAENEGASDRHCRSVANDAITKMTRTSYHKGEYSSHLETLGRRSIIPLATTNSKARGPKKFNVLREHLIKLVIILIIYNHCQKTVIYRRRSDRSGSSYPASSGQNMKCR
ncbi:uncharacterized protein [Ptychodera flava]|uniref:uncharacterized protein n=1 Tax=Ptychodera flava TaxID=63121 RepID=UPI003969E6DF